MNKPIICEVVVLEVPREPPPAPPAEPQLARAPEGNGHEAALKTGGAR